MADEPSKSNEQAAHPIGVFDSGVGGLSVLRGLRARLPYEDLLYVADSGHVPYGDKAQAYVQQRAHVITTFLVAQGVKAVVIACNTATAAAAAYLRSLFSVPIVAIEPAVKPAAAATRRGVVGVMATESTVQSAAFARLQEHFGSEIQIVAQGCPGLAERVEAGDLDGAATRALVQTYTAPLMAAGADIIVLGCTHYPFLSRAIQEAVGPDVLLVESGAAVARRLAAVLDERGLRTPNLASGAEQFWTSGDPAAVGPVLSTLWGRSVNVQQLPAQFA